MFNKEHFRFQFLAIINKAAENWQVEGEWGGTTEEKMRNLWCHRASSNARLSLWLQDRLLDPPVMRMLLQLPGHLPPRGTHGLENQVRTGVMCSQVLC